MIRVLMYKEFSLPWKLDNPYYHSAYLDTTGWRPFNSRPHFVKPSYKPMYSSPPTKPHHNHSRWNFNWLSPLKSLICAKIHTIQSFFRNGRPNRQKPHRKPSYHGRWDCSLSNIFFNINGSYSKNNKKKCPFLTKDNK